jgi:hypothetical protein
MESTKPSCSILPDQRYFIDSSTDINQQKLSVSIPPLHKNDATLPLLPSAASAPHKNGDKQAPRFAYKKNYPDVEPLHFQLPKPLMSAIEIRAEQRGSMLFGAEATVPVTQKISNTIFECFFNNPSTIASLPGSPTDLKAPSFGTTIKREFSYAATDAAATTVGDEKPLCINTCELQRFQSIASYSPMSMSSSSYLHDNNTPSSAFRRLDLYSPSTSRVPSSLSLQRPLSSRNCSNATVATTMSTDAISSTISSTSNTFSCNARSSTPSQFFSSSISVEPLHRRATSESPCFHTRYYSSFSSTAATNGTNGSNISSNFSRNMPSSRASPLDASYYNNNKSSISQHKEFDFDLNSGLPQQQQSYGNSSARSAKHYRSGIQRCQSQPATVLATHPYYEPFPLFTPSSTGSLKKHCFSTAVTQPSFVG